MFATASVGERAGMQMGMIRQMGGIAAGEAGNEKAWIGGLMIAMEQGVIGKMSITSAEKLGELLAKGTSPKEFGEAMEKAQKAGIKKQEDIEEAQLKAGDIAKQTHTTLARISTLLGTWYLNIFGGAGEQGKQAEARSQGISELLKRELMTEVTADYLPQALRRMEKERSEATRMGLSYEISDEQRTSLYKSIEKIGKDGTTEKEKESIDRIKLLTGVNVEWTMVVEGQNRIMIPKVKERKVSSVETG